MKTAIRVISILLVIFLLAGCSKANDVPDDIMGFTPEMSQEEQAVADLLKAVYNGFPLGLLTDIIKDGNEEIAGAVVREAAGFASLSVSKVIAKDVGVHEDGRVYAVSVLYNDDKTLVNDIIIVENEQIVFQRIYSDEVQEDFIETADVFSGEISDAFSVCLPELNVLANVTETVLCVKPEVVTINNDSGERITVSENEEENYVKENAGLGGETEEDSSENAIPGIVDTTAPATKGSRKLVWNHEFNVYDVGQLYSHFTNERDHMTSTDSNLVTSMDSSNYYVQDGNMILRITSDGNKNYTTARSVSTYNKMSFKYGYLEMRAKVPYKVGVWPSFWMKPDTNLKQGNYSGEIDIFEVFSSTNTCVPNLHKWYGSSASDTIGNRGKFTGQRKYVFSNTTNLSNTYHTYGFEWTADEMKFYVDGTCYYTVSIKEEDDYSTAHPGMSCFHDYYYICLNNWVYTDQQSGASSSLHVENLPDFGTVDYTIDYIRLYQGSGESIKIYQ